MKLLYLKTLIALIKNIHSHMILHDLTLESHDLSLKSHDLTLESHDLTIYLVHAEGPDGVVG